MLSRTTTTLLEGLADPGNGSAWRRFYDRYTPMLLSFARRTGLNDADAQDVVSDTLITFLQKYREGRYDRTRGRLKSWLGGIARYKICKCLSKGRSISLSLSTSGDSQGLPEPAAAGDPDATFEHEWRLQRLNEALEVLRGESDPTTYQAFDLYALKKWPVEKVASFLELKPNSVYISKSRMLKRLRQIVERLTAEEE